LRSRRPTLPFAAVESDNNFPTAAGLASSASGFAALVVAANHDAGTGIDRDGLAELARRSSGSAARSMYGGFVELELTNGGQRTMTQTILERHQWPLEVVIAITSRRPKAVGSTDGMVLSERTSPYYHAWVDTSAADLDEARSAIADQDFEALAVVSEHSCLKMHAVALASRPGLLYWNPTTVRCIEKIRALRAQGTAVFFTVDAGPQVKAICEPEAVPRVRTELAAVSGVEQILVAGLGDGATVVDP
jgi:diphosphomevalonate decarboxylase